MFEWDKSCQRLNIPADRVLRLYRSLGETHVALPGLASQTSAVYLIAYAGERGGHVVVAFHLLESHRLAIYRHVHGEVPPDKVKDLLGEAIRFAESLGFILDAVDFQHLSPQQKIEHWNSLPMVGGADAGQPGSTVVGAKASASSGHRPAPDELHERRRFFIEKLGRFLATL